MEHDFPLRMHVSKSAHMLCRPGETMDTRDLERRRCKFENTQAMTNPKPNHDQLLPGQELLLHGNPTIDASGGVNCDSLRSIKCRMQQPKSTCLVLGCLAPSETFDIHGQIELPLFRKRLNSLHPALRWQLASCFPRELELYFLSFSASRNLWVDVYAGQRHVGYFLSEV